jgi:anti-sigma regulatory factor (Ser/Thr protein kinase)
VLRDWGARVDADVAELLLSEVVTNAVLHGIGESSGPDEHIEIDLTLTLSGLRVEVHDPDLGGGEGVGVRQPEMDSEHGHGLELVEALSASWGCEPTAEGKYVFFTLEPVDQAPEDDGAGSAIAVDGDRRGVVGQ